MLSFLAVTTFGEDYRLPLIFWPKPCRADYPR